MYRNDSIRAIYVHQSVNTCTCNRSPVYGILIASIAVVKYQECMRIMNDELVMSKIEWETRI